MHGVQRLCEDLGCTPSGQEPTDGAAELSDPEKPQTLKSQLSDVVAAIRTSTDKTVAVQSSLAEVVEATKSNHKVSLGLSITSAWLS